VAYCVAHPEERFWQALRNWAGMRTIQAVPEIASCYCGRPYKAKGNKYLYEIDAARHDTFFWEGRNG
jgi:hypothetical protein